MHKDLDIFKETLLAIWKSRRHQPEMPRRENGYNSKIQPIYLAIKDSYPHFLNDRHFELKLPGNSQPSVDFSEHRNYLYLDPIESPLALPILTLKCDFTHTIPEVSLRLGLFISDPGSVPPVKGLGFRFETPGGRSAENESIHRYYHVQMFKSFQKGGSLLPGVPPWLPAVQPALPLDCESPISLLITLMISLYGIDRATALCRQASSLAEILKQMEKRRTHTINYYRTNGRSGVEYYRTGDPVSFQIEMKAQKKRTVEEIKALDYFAQLPEHQRIF